MRNKFIISETERRNILNQHNSLKSFIFEDTTSGSTTGTTQQSEPRWKSLVNVNKVKAIQARMNDECPRPTLNAVLEKYPRARQGTTPNYTLKEDGIDGKGTKASFQACNGNWIIGGINGVAVSTTPGTVVSTAPKIGEPLNANDIATLTSA